MRDKLHAAISLSLLVVFCTFKKEAPSSCKLFRGVLQDRSLESYRKIRRLSESRLSISMGSSR